MIHVAGSGCGHVRAGKGGRNALDTQELVDIYGDQSKLHFISCDPVQREIFHNFYFVISSFSDYLFKLLLIGDSGVGKSCLLLRFAVSLGVLVY